MRIAVPLILLACAVPSIAQSTRPGNNVDALIAKLSSESWQDRQTAQERLVQRGEESTDALKRLLSSTTDPEAKSLAETALAQIEENRLIGASIITIRGDDLLPRDAFKQLAEQSGARLEPMPANLFASMPQNRISLDIDHQPFWTAMNELTFKTGITALNWNNQMMLTNRQPAILGRSFVSGPYMVVASSVARSRSVDLASNVSAQQFNVQLTVMAEPKIRLNRAAAGAKIESAVDERGASLAPKATGATDFGYYSQMGNSWQATAMLTSAETPGTRIAKLRGTIHAIICTRVDRVEIPDVMGAKGVERSFEGARITLVDVVRKQDAYELRLRARLTGADRDWSRLPLNEIRLVDARGGQLQTRGATASVVDDAYDLTLQFAAVPANGHGITEPANLVWEIPIETKSVQIPFEFEDLPIP